MSGILPLDDVTTSALQVALDATAQQQQIIAQNISNASTPNYRAQQVTFQNSLAQALAHGDPLQTQVVTSPTNDPVKADGNSVDVTGQLTSLQKTDVQYQALVAAFNFKNDLITAAIGK